MELPEDLISEIFSWLPAKSICKFKSCSKSISKLTQETEFSLKQSRNSMIRNIDSCFFIQSLLSRSFFPDIYALPGDEKSSGVPRNFLHFLGQTSSRILASSNGLLLCENLKRGRRQLFICNPITESCVDIPSPNKLIQSPSHSFVKFILQCNHDKGSDVNSEAYKLILLFHYDRSTYDYEIETYTPKYGAWKAIGGGFSARRYFGILCTSPLIYKGDLHILLIDVHFYFCCKHDFIPRIVVHQLENGASKFLSLPKEAFENIPRRGLDMRISKWGEADESICFLTLVNVSVFTLWVLSDYESSSWSRNLTISLEDIIGPGLNSVTALGFTIMNGKSLVFATRSGLYKYDLVGERNNNKKAGYISNYGYDPEVLGVIQFGLKLSLDVISYSPTLQSCGIGATTNFSLREELK
ncbi:hypothetical protein K1719_026472 [Acacia pycnantha]|nr:hypothetical protein K1719_026472 [Acacia pycnantha]